MPDPTPIPVFDGHNDMLLRFALHRERTPEQLFAGDPQGHIDLPRARAGGFAGGLFAVFPPPLRGEGPPAPKSYADRPMPAELALEPARTSTVGMLSILLRLERAFPDDLAVCRDVGDIRAAMASGRIAAVMHIEGAEAIDPDLAMLDVLHAAGLRSLGLVWSRPNAFAHGVPFRFPSTGDIGPGLTEHGRALVRACNARRILVDLSHLNERGFWDVADLTDAPLVASHSNVHALCASSRNLTARQLDAIRDSRGLVGLNFACSFLRPDGAMRSDTDLDVLRRHLDALLEHLGEDGVALGSDFDGAAVPAAIGSAAGLPALFDQLANAGYGDDLLRKIGAENWLGVLERTWR
ncbi:membrane dipeptidase [Lichenibacterium minor]|uniref:Membrane dipeptidase n=1 Tax=Lichenibacterium minor TaxID=2316528 RepID=A0A4Q2U7J6_9HYPH|nr:dipeptidase [Lichenibacterium minor]RYC32420.1 membrane dipeptidase [Lichenibacterium minor]